MPARGTHTDTDAVRLVDDLLAAAIRRRASDAHFEPGESAMWVRYRLDGVLQDVDRLPLELAENVVARLKVLAGLLTYRLDVPQEGSFRADARIAGDLPAIDIRVATFPTIRGERAVIRFLYESSEVNHLAELGFRREAVTALREAAGRPQGLILVTGPAGSGKSTTLYALARHILAATPGRSVVSLEDPVEQRIDGVAQIQITPHGELDYARAMRSLLRQDVQVMLIGEIRDAATAHVVVEAALTGHLVMSTMHSGDPAEALVRLLEMGIAPYQLVGAVSTICAQRLLRTLCPECAGASSVAADLRVGRTCDACADTGYRGRTACCQTVTLDDALRQAVLYRRPVQELRSLINAAEPAGDGESALLADAMRLVEAGRTDIDEVRRMLGAPDESAGQRDSGIAGRRDSLSESVPPSRHPAVPPSRRPALPHS